MGVGDGSFWGVCKICFDRRGEKEGVFLRRRRKKRVKSGVGKNGRGARGETRQSGCMKKSLGLRMGFELGGWA